MACSSDNLQYIGDRLYGMVKKVLYGDLYSGTGSVFPYNAKSLCVAVEGLFLGFQRHILPIPTRMHDEILNAEDGAVVDPSKRVFQDLPVSNCIAPTEVRGMHLPCGDPQLPAQAMDGFQALLSGFLYRATFDPERARPEQLRICLGALLRDAVLLEDPPDGDRADA